MSAKKVLLVAGSLCSVPLLWLGMERLVSDAATRFAYQIRNEALWMQITGEQTRVFEHWPKSWPQGIEGAYRIESSKGNSVVPGRRTVGVARNLTEPVWYSTSYHLNYVDVPTEVGVAHKAGEPTKVILERREGKVLLKALE